MKTVIRILMERDNMCYEDAKELAQECKEEMLDLIAQGEYIQAEETFMDYLGLEPDYMISFIM